MTSPFLTKCVECRHFRDLEAEGKNVNLGVANGFKPVCSAFPDAIPNDVYLWKVEHTEKLPGQVGNFVFERGTPEGSIDGVVPPAVTSNFSREE